MNCIFVISLANTRSIGLLPFKTESIESIKSIQLKGQGGREEGVRREGGGREGRKKGRNQLYLHVNTNLSQMLEKEYTVWKRKIVMNSYLLDVLPQSTQ